MTELKQHPCGRELGMKCSHCDHREEAIAALSKTHQKTEFYKLLRGDEK